MNLLGVLLVIFVVLKLVGVVAWSWLLVLSPLWGPLALAAALVTVENLMGWGLSILDRWRRARMGLP